MLKIAKTEVSKLKRYSVIWIGVATMLTVVLLTRFMATAEDGAVHTLENFSDSVIWNNFSLIFPATITMTVFFISRFPGFSFAGMMAALFKMIGMNLFVYVAVLPIIIFTGQRAGSFMAGVGFSFFYGFVGTFASGHGLGNIYPITAGLSLINYQNGEITAYNKVLSTGILFLMFTVSNVMVLFSKNKVPTAKANKKVKTAVK